MPGSLALCVALGAMAQGVAAAPEVRVASRPYTPHAQVFTSQSDLVQALVVVRDDRGHAIAGLGQDRFRLLVDGKPAAISGFAVETAPAAGAGGGTAATAMSSSVSSSGSRGKAPLGPMPVKAASQSRPRYVALFVDDLSLDPVALTEARHAVEKLSGKEMTGDIRLGIFTSSGAVTLPFTSDRTAWQRTLGKIQYRARMPRRGLIAGTDFGPELAYLVKKTPSAASPYTALAMGRMAQASLCISQSSCHEVALAEADTTVKAAENNSLDILSAMRQVIEALAAQPGERILLLSSTGFFADTLGARLQAVTEEALRDKVVIDAVDAKMLETEPPRARPLDDIVAFNERGGLNAPMATLADDTGGTFTQNSNDLAAAMGRAISQPEAAYSLSFAPAAMPADGKFHNLKVEVAGLRHAAVQTRKGYFDPAPEDDIFRAATPSAAVDAAVLGPEHPDDLRARLATVWHGDDLRVAIRLNPARLHFDDCDDARRCEDLVFTSAVFDKAGKFVTGKTGAMGLALTSHGYKSLLKTGVGAVLTLRLPAGEYRLREVVQEGNRGEFAAYDEMIHPGS